MSERTWGFNSPLGHSISRPLPCSFGPGAVVVARRPRGCRTGRGRRRGAAPATGRTPAAPRSSPGYCVHGYAECSRCRETCWLGEETYRRVTQVSVQAQEPESVLRERPRGAQLLSVLDNGDTEALFNLGLPSNVSLRCDGAGGHNLMVRDRTYGAALFGHVAAPWAVDADRWWPDRRRSVRRHLRAHRPRSVVRRRLLRDRLSHRRSGDRQHLQQRSAVERLYDTFKLFTSAAGARGSSEPVLLLLVEAGND